MEVGQKYEIGRNTSVNTCFLVEKSVIGSVVGLLVCFLVHTMRMMQILLCFWLHDENMMKMMDVRCCFTVNRRKGKKDDDITNFLCNFTVCCSSREQ